MTCCGALIDHAVETYFPDLAEAPDRPLALLERVRDTAARLVARWMAAGFVHGVLNTDNMTITGESFDYGPWRFLPRNDPNFVAAYFDRGGLYSFGRQPEAVFWNLKQLAGALSAVTPVDPMVAVLEGFAERYRDELAAAMVARLGLERATPAADAALANLAFARPRRGRPEACGGSRSFSIGSAARRRKRGRWPVRAPASTAARCSDAMRAAFETREATRTISAASTFDRAEPEELLIEEVEALWSAIAERDDWAPLAAKLEAIEATRQAFQLA